MQIDGGLVREVPVMIEKMEELTFARHQAIHDVGVLWAGSVTPLETR
jgi:hypothetical protein